MACAVTYAFTTLQETEKAHDKFKCCVAPAAPGKSGAVECLSHTRASITHTGIREGHDQYVKL